MSDNPDSTVSSKPASASDHIWYFDDDDDLPMSTSVPKSDDPVPASPSPPANRDAPQMPHKPAAPTDRPRRAAALANPFIRAGFRFKSGLEELNKDLAGHPRARVVASERRSNAKPISEKVLGKRRAVSPVRRTVKRSRGVQRSIATRLVSECSSDTMSRELGLQEISDGDKDDPVEASQPPLRRLFKRNSYPSVVESEESDEPKEPDEVIDLDQLAEKDYSKRNPFGPGRDPNQRTEDVRTVFRTVFIKRNGIPIKVYKCNICEQEGRHHTFSGSSSISTLRRHIASKLGHFDIYETKCNQAGLAMHERAVPPKRGEDGSIVQQLIAFPVVKPPTTFTAEGLIRRITALLAQDDQAMLLADSIPFRDICLYLRPTITDKDIPHRTTVTSEIEAQANYAVKLISKKFEKVTGRISVAHDMGESPFARDPYHAVNAFWIAGTPENPNDWRLHSQCIAFRLVEGRHDARTIASILYRAYEDYGVLHKVGWPVGDNASVNGAAVRQFAKALIKHDPDNYLEWKNHKAKQGRCIEHQCNNAAERIFHVISPTSAQAINKKLSKGGSLYKAIDSDSDDDDNHNQFVLLDISDSDDDDSASDDRQVAEAGDDELSMSDLFGKIFALIAAIRKSPQARRFFESQCLAVGIRVLRLKTYVRTRWSSVYDLLVRLIEVKPALRKFFLLADDDDSVPNLKNKTYASFKISDEEWVVLKKVQDVLKPIALACQSFSSDSTSALYRAIPALEFIMEQWEAKLSNNDYLDLHPAIEAGLDNLRKWYRHMDDTELYIINLVLNPRYKMRYIECKWGDDDSKKALKVVQQTFDKYSAKVGAAHSVSPNIAATSAALHEDNNYGIAFMEAIVMQGITEEPTGPREELRRYLESPRESPEDVIHWWGHHQDVYPVLSMMAMDYLAVPASSTSAERLFSSAGHIGTIHRTLISPRHFEALQILKSSYKAGDITVDTQRPPRQD